MRKSAAPSSKLSGLSSKPHVSWPSNALTKPVITSKPKFEGPASKDKIVSNPGLVSTSTPPGAARSTASILGLLSGNLSKENDSVEKNSVAKLSEKENISTSLLKEKPSVEKPEAQKSTEIEICGKRIFTVVWGKPTTKKHKTWEGDGTLEVEDTDVTLKDENGKILGRASKIKPAELEEGKRIKVGSKEVELIDLLSSTPASAKRPLEAEVPQTSCWKKLKKSHSTLGSTAKKINSGNQPLQMSPPTSNHQWEYNTARLPVVPVFVDGFLSNILRPHQRVGVRFLYDCVTGLRNLKRKGAILADEMGLGKTLQCITLIWTLLKQGPYGGRPLARRVLIVSPSSLVQNWEKEFNRWLGVTRLRTFAIDQKNRPSEFVKRSHLPVMIVSYEMLIRLFEEIRNIKFELLICDEGHRLKNSNIRTSVALSQLEIDARVILTGTPIQNDLQEFLALVNFVNPGILGSQSEFRKYFEEPIITMQQPEATEDVIFVGKKRAEELNALTRGFILRRTHEVIDKYLPKKTETVVFVKPSSLQLSLYYAALHWWANHETLSGCGESGVHFSVMMTLKKLCNHPSVALSRATSKDDINEDFIQQSGLLAILSDKYSRLTGSTGDPFCDQSGKLLVVRGILKSLSALKERIVLVSYFTQTLNILASLCDGLGLTHCRLDGSTPVSQRVDLVDKFNASNSKFSVFLLSARAGGVGLNLTGASRLLLFDSDWNPANDLQAMSRVWRDGQRRDVYIYRLLTCGTIEEKIFQRQLSKTGLSGSIVDPNSVGGVRMSKAELKDLFTPQEGCTSLTHESLECPCSGLGTVPDVPLTLEDEDEDENDCQITLEPNSNATRLSKLSMNQLMLWQHHAPPFDSNFLKELALTSVHDNLVFMFCNPSATLSSDDTSS